jgi:putative tryptophan/tyrosine transport system substrate-binding protein
MAALPLAAGVQRVQRVPGLGIISYEFGRDPNERERREAFTARLRELGWIEGRNIHTDNRFAGNDAELMRTYARELVAIEPDVIFAATFPMASPLQ